MLYLQRGIEKHLEMQKELHMVSIDLEKAYDIVPGQDVWRRLREQRMCAS